ACQGRRGDHRGPAAVGPGGPDPRRTPAPGTGRGGHRRPGTAPTAHRHLLLPVCRGRGAADRARPGRLRGLVRELVHGEYASAITRPGGDGRAYPRQSPGIAAPWRVRRRRRSFPRRASGRGTAHPIELGSPVMWRRRTGGGSAPDRAESRVETSTESGGAAEPRLTVNALGRKCPIPIIMLAERI